MSNHGVTFTKVKDAERSAPPVASQAAYPVSKPSHRGSLSIVEPLLGRRLSRDAQVRRRPFESILLGRTGINLYGLKVPLEHARQRWLIVTRD